MVERRDVLFSSFRAQRSGAEACPELCRRESRGRMPHGEQLARRLHPHPARGAGLSHGERQEAEVAGNGSFCHPRARVRRARGVPALCCEITSLLFLLGCAARPPAPVPQTVVADVPVARRVYCDVKIPARPALPIAALAPSATPADVVRAYAASVALLKGAVVAREALLRGCARPSPRAPSSASPLPAGAGNGAGALEGAAR